MNQQLKDYIEAARKAGQDDASIKESMVGAGWQASQVDAALTGKVLPVPPPPPPPSGAAQPVAVVSSMSNHGFEYWIMFLSMGITAGSLGWVLHSLVDGLFATSGSGFYSETVSFATSAILVALPVFAFLFLRLKKAEIADPTLYSDTSRRRAVQLTLIVTFLVGISKIITYIYSLLNGEASSYSGASISPFSNLVHTFVTISIAGLIFAYYWHDQHKVQK